MKKINLNGISDSMNDGEMKQVKGGLDQFMVQDDFGEEAYNVCKGKCNQPTTTYCNSTPTGTSGKCQWSGLTCKCK